MSYFADLSPHTYISTGGLGVLNIGWLEETRAFPQGSSSPEFRDALGRLCERPCHLHRGFHTCQFCDPEVRRGEAPGIGNGQIRIKGPCGTWFAAPTMIHHYVVAHGYLPPPPFVTAVLRPVEVATDAG